MTMKPITPEKLRHGDTVRVVAPAQSLSMIVEDSVGYAIDRLNEMGLNVSFGEHARESDMFVSSSIESRVEDLHDAFEDDSVKAILTVIGYSVNDTIVVFDRIRENRGKLTTVSVPVINKSVNQTLARTLLTSGTTFIVVFIMYFWGGQGIKAFNYALLIGIIFGTYSSVAIASPLLMGFRKALVTRAAEAVAT